MFDICSSFEATSQEEVLKRSESTALILHRLTQDELLTGFDLPSFYLPSQETQRPGVAPLSPIRLRS